MMDISYLSYSEEPIQAQLLMNLYHNAGWWEERQEKDIERVLRSGLSVGAWENERLVGFARAVSDGIFRAYVEDVVVENSYHGKGVGKKLVSRLLEELSNIPIISLFCEEELTPFYQKK